MGVSEGLNTKASLCTGFVIGFTIGLEFGLVTGFTVGVVKGLLFVKNSFVDLCKTIIPTPIPTNQKI